MINFSTFSDELVKISEQFNPLGAGYAGVRVKAKLPVVSKLSKKPAVAKRQLVSALAGANVPSVLGHKNVVVPVRVMPDMEAMGFRPTRVATPLPGERPFTVSYRAGRLHAHRIGPAFLVHQDKESPMGRGGYLNLRAAKHGILEGVPSVARRIRERGALVVGAEND